METTYVFGDAEPGETLHDRPAMSRAVWNAPTLATVASATQVRVAPQRSARMC